MEIPEEEKQRQLARAGEYSQEGLPEFIIAGMVIITAALGLRLWSRRMVKIDLKSDDYTLIVAWFLTICASITNLIMILHGGLGRHTVLLTPEKYMIFGKASYAWDILYTTAYPIARISLVLLYHRVFIQQWFRHLCHFLIFAYAGYALGSGIAGFCQGLPLASNWDINVKPKSHINDKDLYMANAGFNISTDAILLFMPLAVIWSMSMTRAHKIGLSFVFGFGVLTLLASIFRLVYYYEFDVMDPMYSLGKAGWWTIIEMYLGIVCPCLVTFRPLIKSAFIVFSEYLGPNTRRRVERVTGPSSAYARDDRDRDGGIGGGRIGGAGGSSDRDDILRADLEKGEGKSGSESSAPPGKEGGGSSWGAKSSDSSPSTGSVPRHQRMEGKQEAEALASMDLESPPEEEAHVEEKKNGYFESAK